VRAIILLFSACTDRCARALADSQIEKVEFQKISEAHQKVRTEIQQYRTRLQAAENEVNMLQKEINELDPSAAIAVASGP